MDGYYSELLSSYLDGELDADETATLFSRLAHDSDLQAEMRDLLMLHQGFRAELLVPAPDLTEKVFQRTVLADRSVAIGSAAAGAGAAGAGGARGQVLMAAMISGVASALLTLLVVTQVIPGNRVAGSVTRQADTLPAASAALVPGASTDAGSGKVAVPATPSKAAVASDLPSTATTHVSVTHSPGSVSRHNRGGSSNIVTSPAVIDRNVASAVSVTPSESSVDRVTVKVAPIAIADPIMPTAEAPVVKLFPGDTPAILPGTPPEQDEKKFSLSLRGFASRSFPDFDLDPLTDPPLNNVAVGVLYNVTGHHALGLELGQEHFMQRYEGRVNGARVTYEQNYLALWGGVVYHYRFGGIEELGGVEPVARVMAGGMRTGPLGRLTLGAQFDWGGVTLMAGAEGALALYPYQGIWFASRTLGATYGFSIQF